MNKGDEKEREQFAMQQSIKRLSCKCGIDLDMPVMRKTTRKQLKSLLQQERGKITLTQQNKNDDHDMLAQMSSIRCQRHVMQDRVQHTIEFKRTTEERLDREEC